MVEVTDWRQVDRDLLIEAATQTLAQGQLVAFPTETVYGLAASALSPEGVERLIHSKRRPDEKPLTMAVSGAPAALDWIPNMSRLGRRLARRCWPGPVTLVFDLEQGGGVGSPGSLASRLPEQVRQRVCPAGTLGLRVPQHDAILNVLQALPGPLVLSSANRSGEPAATTAQEVVEAAGDHLALVIDDGPSPFGQASTVVRVQGKSWRVLREGVVPATTLEQLSPCLIVFVCTGNTCRSPLAEVLCKQLLAEKLGCTPQELPQRGFQVVSAGLAAMNGGPAADEAVEVARTLGADLSEHQSQQVTAELVAQADYLFAMTRSHLRALHGPPRRGSSAAPSRGATRPRLLCRDGNDLPDPVGGDQDVYRECAQQILRHLEDLLPSIVSEE
jgi:protein-tyrosine phosphatase